MKMNRRNVLVGLGALGIGGGALLGSGAFTSVEADREVEINVITGPDIGENYADVLLYAGGFDTVTLNNQGSGGDSASDLFPTSSDSYEAFDPEDREYEDYVSLIDNNVNIVFGAENGLPTNSNVNYDGLFVVVNEDEDESDEDFKVTLELNERDSDFLHIGGDDLGYSVDPIEAGESEELDGVVDTEAGSDGDTLTLTIRIEQA